MSLIETVYPVLSVSPLIFEYTDLGKSWVFKPILTKKALLENILSDTPLSEEQIIHKAKIEGYRCVGYFFGLSSKLRKLEDLGLVEMMHLKREYSLCPPNPLEHLKYRLRKN